ncbi:hypothetical protein FJ364_04780 [Candidatus Dependentiae bacterium]|nr:hypothetical protein [Candidatus Dependentiae bacterium]
MESKELVGLYEAYQQVYEPQELVEEVEIATEYFYEMGLNENGIDILIEELGEEEFVNWVYDIAEEYTLSEADQTRLQKMAAAKGKIVIGPTGSRPQSTTKAAIQKMGGTTKRIGSSQRPGSTISGKRQNAASTAVSQQAPTSSTPQQTKGGIGGLIGSIVQRAKQDTELLGKSIQTARDVASRRGAEVAAGYNALRARGRGAEQSAAATRARRKAIVAAGKAAKAAGRTAIKAAGAAGAAAGEGVKAHRQGKTGAQIAGRAAGTFVSKMTREEYEYILEHLLDEGYANSIENAEKIAMNMSEEWKQSIVEVTYGAGDTSTPADKRMVVTNADKIGNTKAYQELKKGNPAYVAAPHLKGV